MKSTTSAALGCSTDTIITAKGGNNQNNNYMQTIAMSRPALPAAAVTSTSFIQRIYRQLLLATFVLLGLGVGQSWGQLLLSENFTSYSIGNLGGQGSWTQAGSGPLATINNASPFTYSGYNGGLGGEYAVIPTASSTSSRCYKGFTSTAFANKTFYYSVIINLTSVSATGDYFITLGDPTTGTTYFARLFAKASGGGYNLGISKISNTASYGSSIYNLNQSYLVVVRYTSSSTTTTDDGVYMWVNPTLSVTEPTTGTAEASILPAALLTDPAPSGGNVGNFHWHNRSTNNPVGKFDGVKVSVGSTSGAAWTSLDALACTAPSITSATAGANPICANATTTLTAVVTGTNPSVTWWTGPNGTGTPVGTGLVSDPVGPGTYHAYATGDCGTDDETVVVTGQALPNAGTDGTLNICSSTTLTEALLFGALNGSPSGGGSWSPSPAGAGVYTYTVAATAPCTVDATATVTVSVQALPNAGTDGTLTICSSTTLTTTLLFNALGGTPDGTGSWSPAPAGAGVYTYTVTGTSPCPNASATVTVSVQAAPNATIAYSAATYTTADAAQSVNITGTPNTGTFSAPGGLSINAATGQITPSTSTPATYLVTYTVAASGECPLYTTTTSVTINLYVATPLDCATPLNFSSPVVLLATQAPNVWYTDRYAPNGFAISNDLGGSTLKHSISALDGEGSRPGGFNTAFYNTQGRKYDLEANSATLKIKLYVPASWATSNKRMAGLWGTAFDNANVISAYPIIEFNSDGGNPRFRGWESGTSVWVDLGLPGGFAYDTWVELSIKLRSDGEFQYKVGNLVYTTTTSSGDGSVKLANTILQGHNNNPGVTYDIYWDDLASNTVSLFTNAVTGCGTADLTTAAVTSGSVLPGGTTLGYFTDQACAFSVPDATQVGAGPYYIRATAPGGCFEVQPVTVTIQAAPTATIAYSAATYTTADPAQSVNITGTPNTGTFSAPAGLSINAATGQITPSTSTPGSYVVTYTVAASGVCPLYTTTTNVTINLFVPALLDCATPLDFSSAVALSPTQAPNVWYTDRYAPNGFAISNDLGGSTLKHSINAADGQPGTALPIIGFYNTQGRKYDLEANSASLKIKLYVPASWASSGRRMAGLWGTAFDNTNNVSGYPIVEFSANSEGTGVPRFRCYETGSGAWVDLGLPAGFVYDSWVEMSIKLRSDGEFQYKVGNLVYTTTTGSGDGSVKIANVILQGYNLTTGVTYDIYWDDLASNTVSLIVTNPTGACPSVSLTASAVTALSKMPLGTTLSYFTNPACTFSVPDATQVGSGTYYIKATAPGGCFDVEPVTVSIPGSVHNVTQSTDHCTIQAAIDAANPGDHIKVDAGTYHESASNRYVFGVNGPHKFGLFIDKDNLIIEGLDAGNSTVTSAGNAAAVVTTNATNNFGTSGIFVQANGVTIKGLKIGDNYNDANVLDNNKTFEIVGNNFTLDKTWVSTASDEGAVYMGRWDAVHPITAYSFTDNKFENTLISINNGVGLSGPRAGRVITGNEFVGVATPYLIGFRGWNGAGPVQGWIVDPVGGAVVTGNTFNTTGVVNYIVARGNAGGYVNSELDWSEMWNMNTYGNHVVTLTNYPGFDVRTYTDGAGYPQTRRISPAIQENIDIAAAGDAVLVSAGTFNESLNVNKSVSLIGAQAGVCAPTRAGAESIINSVNGNGINASGVTIDGFTIQGQTSAAGPGWGYAVYMAPGNTGTKLLNNIIKDNVIGSSLSNQGASPAQVQITCNWFKDNNNPGSATGSGIYTDEYVSGGIISNVLINNNKFSGNNSAGIDHSTTQASMASTGISIDGNEFSNNYRATFLYNLTNSSFTNNEVSGSTFAGSGDLRIYAGVHNFNVSNNKFAAGTDVRAIRISTDGVENNSGITVNYNSFTGYTSTNKAIEIVSGYPGTLAGTCNWFGTTVPATVAAQLSASVNHVPYLTSGVDISPAVSGFQTNEVCATCALVATPSSTNVTCPTQADGTASVTLTGGTGPYTYDWGVYGSTQTITGLTAGSYPVTVTDINGCTATTTAVVGGAITGPVQNTNSGLYYCTIQAAIDAPQTLSGHTITVAAGTYAEDIVVSKSLTILGPNAAINACSGTRVAEAIVVPATAAISSGEIFHVAASDVTISGFTIDGDNSLLNSGFTSTNGADIDAAEGITVYETGVNNLTVTNNIIKNLSYFGVTLYDYPAGVASSGHVIADNKIQDLGTYDAGSGLPGWGGGVLLYNNQYAAVTNNCMSNVRIGVQTGNFSQANPGGPASQVISGNTISARRRGIFHNLFYGAASPYTVSNNIISGVVNANEVVWDGILIASQAIASTASNNIINGAGITNPSEGIEVWNSLPAPTVSGGNISNVNIGVSVNNFEGYNSDADPTAATIDGVTISGVTAAGVKIHDNPLNTNGATVTAEVKNTTITGGAAGILVSGADATANIHNNPSTITGAAIGIDVNAGAATVYRNTITANGIGVRSINGGKLTSVTENFITNNTSDGIQVAADAGVTGNINTNNLAGNTGFGINNLSAPTLAATCNWFGSNVAAAVAAKVSGNVTYILYLATGTDEQPGTSGFQNTSCKTIVVADPALVDVNITTTSDALINANLVPLNSTNRVHVPILNLDQDPAHIIPAGTTKVRIDLGDKLKLNLSFNLATAPLSTYFNWSKVVESGNDVIYGDQVADIPADFVGDAWFEVDAVTPGTSLITSNFQVTNHNNLTQFLVDVVTTNNAANLTYTVLNAFTITLDNTTDVTCFGGSDGSITVHANGGATPYQYSIDGGTTWLPAVPTAGGHTFSGLTAGTYTIQARDFLLQIVTLVPNVTITEPPVITLSPTETHVNVSCYSGSDGSIDLSVSGGGGTPGYTYAYSWTASSGGVVPFGQENNQDLSGLLPGDYTVQVTVTDNASCVKVFPAALTVTITQPAILSATVNSTNVLCNGANDGTITITLPTGGYGTYEYRLDAGAWQSSGNFTGLAPATYNVQIRDAAHPTCTQVIASVLITEPTVLNAAVTAINHVTCAGNSSGSVTVTATGGTPGYEYSLDGGAFLNNGGTFTGLAAGPHTVVAKDANGCLKSVPFTITEPLNTDITLGAVFDNNFFLANGDEITVVYNIIEIGGKAATPAVLRIFKPAGYDVIFNNTLTTSMSLAVDNQKWTQTFSNSLYYEFTRNGPGGNNTINCYEFLRLGFTVKRNTFNVSTFNLNAQFRAAVSEVILNNNNISLLLVGQ